MKYFLSIIFLCSISIRTIAQDLNYNDLKNILNYSLADSNDLLESKGYRIFKSNFDDNDDEITYKWDKGRNSNIPISYVFIMWSQDVKVVSYFFHSLNHFNSIKNNLEQIGFKLMDNYVKSGYLVYVYSIGNYTVQLEKGEKKLRFFIQRFDNIKRFD